MSVYKSLSEFSIDDEMFDVFESFSEIVHDIPWKVNLSSPIEEKLLKESCFQSYETRIKSELSKKSITSTSVNHVKCKVNENGFSLKVIVDKSPVLHCLFLGLDVQANSENEQNAGNTRSRKKYKLFTLVLIHGKPMYEKSLLPVIEKLLACQITTLQLSLSDYHWILTLTTHFINSSSVFDNLLQLVYKHPTRSIGKKDKLFMSVEFEKILSLWNDIYTKYKVAEHTISSSMCHRLKTSMEDHFETIFSTNLKLLSLTEIHIEDILKLKIQIKAPVICIEDADVVPVVLYFLFLMSYNQQNW